MSILINSMNIPKSCMGCDLWLKTSEESGICVKLGRLVGGKPRYEREKRRDCPLTEVPTPHGRLIDADDLYNKFKNEYCNRNCGSSVQGKKCDHCGVPRALNIILNAPTIIEAEVSE